LDYQFESIGLKVRIADIARQIYSLIEKILIFVEISCLKDR